MELQVAGDRIHIRPLAGGLLKSEVVLGYNQRINALYIPQYDFNLLTRKHGFNPETLHVADENGVPAWRYRDDIKAWVFPLNWHVVEELSRRLGNRLVLHPYARQVVAKLCGYDPATLPRPWLLSQAADAPTMRRGYLPAAYDPAPCPHGFRRMHCQGCNPRGYPHRLGPRRYRYS